MLCSVTELDVVYRWKVILARVLPPTPPGVPSPPGGRRCQNPSVNQPSIFGQECMSGVTLALALPQPAQAHRGLQLQRFRLLPARIARAWCKQASASASPCGLVPACAEQELSLIMGRAPPRRGASRCCPPLPSPPPARQVSRRAPRMRIRPGQCRQEPWPFNVRSRAPQRLEALAHLGQPGVALALPDTVPPLPDQLLASPWANPCSRYSATLAPSNAAAAWCSLRIPMHGAHGSGRLPGYRDAPAHGPG